MTLVQAGHELLIVQALKRDLPPQSGFGEEGLVAGHEAVVQRPERALIGRTLNDDSGKDRLIAADREVSEDKTGRARRDQLLQNQRLNLSRKPLTAASSEIPVVQNLDGSVGVAEHIALRAHTLVFADDILG